MWTAAQSESLRCPASSPLSKSPPTLAQSLSDAARRPAGRALDRSGKLSPDAALHRRRRRRGRARGRVAAWACGARRSSCASTDLTSFGGRRPRAIVATLGAGAGADRVAGRARAADAAGRARARRPQVHAACHAGAAARIIEPAGRGLSGGARAVPLAAVHRSRASCCSRRAPRSAAAPTWSRRPIRWRRDASRHAGFNSRDCTSSIAVAKPWLSATTSRISDSGVGCGAATSPTTLPKSKLSSRVELARELLHALVVGEARHVQELDAAVARRQQRAFEQRRADAVALPRLLDRERGFGLARERLADGRSSAAPRSMPSTKKPWMTASMPSGDRRSRR